MTAEYRQLVATIYCRHHMPLQRWLRKEFPRADGALIEDAVANAFRDALDRPGSFVIAWQHGGQARLLRLLKQAAWRHLRGHFRRKASQCEIGLLDSAREPSDPITPHTIAAGRETADRIQRLVTEAAERFGGGRPQDLHRALHARLAGGSDTEVARHHQVPREYINRAKRWIGARLLEA